VGQFIDLFLVPNMIDEVNWKYRDLVESK